MEAYWLINFCLDLMLLALSHRSMGRIRWRRLVCSAAAGAGTACLALEMPAIPRWLPVTAGLMVMCLLDGGGREMAARMARLLFCTLYLGGMAALLFRGMGGWRLASFLLLLSVGAFSLRFFWDMRAERRMQRQVLLSLTARGRRVRLEALVDTGNCLREPISHLPVLVAEEALLAPLLPPDYGQSPLPRGFRLVRYGGVGGSGQMLCFLPDEIRSLRQGKWKYAPDMWVALYPGKLPGHAQALAPGELGI